MAQTAHQIGAQLQAKVIGKVELNDSSISALARDRNQASDQSLDSKDFLFGGKTSSRETELLAREEKRVVAEIGELQAGCRWQDIIDLFHPVEEKLPELVAAGLDEEVRLKLSFALSRDNRHEQAMQLLQRILASNRDHVLANYNIGYCVVDLLYTCRKERKPIAPKKKASLICLAHEHFTRARELRPDSVTFAYRQAILYKEIEGKLKSAAPLFRDAVDAWEQLSEDQKQKYHQQRPKYHKAMYHLASCLLGLDRPDESLGLLEKLLSCDQSTNHVQPVFKHFATGKVLHALGRLEESLQHLETAVHRAEKGQGIDYVHELSARNLIELGRPAEALNALSRIPFRRIRPYIGWTRADALVGLGRNDEAAACLTKIVESDRRSQHVALIRLCRIRIRQQRFDDALHFAQAATRFCLQTYTNPSKEGRFWEAVSLYLLGKMVDARRIVDELEDGRFRNPDFHRLKELVRSAGSSGQQGQNRNCRLKKIK